MEERDVKFYRGAQGGVGTELFNQLKQRSNALISNASWFTAVKTLKSPMGARGGNQCIGKTAGCPTTKLRLIVDGAETRFGFTVTAGNVRDSKESAA